MMDLKPTSLKEAILLTFGHRGSELQYVISSNIQPIACLFSSPYTHEGYFISYIISNLVLVEDPLTSKLCSVLTVQEMG